MRLKSDYDKTMLHRSNGLACQVEFDEECFFGGTSWARHGAVECSYPSSMLLKIPTQAVRNQ